MSIDFDKLALLERQIIDAQNKLVKAEFSRDRVRIQDAKAVLQQLEDRQANELAKMKIGSVDGLRELIRYMQHYRKSNHTIRSTYEGLAKWLFDQISTDYEKECPCVMLDKKFEELPADVQAVCQEFDVSQLKVNVTKQQNTRKSLCDSSRDEYLLTMTI